ncbi:MAG: SDR family oxidoreductase [Salinibacterium sp.]|nr:SDR family oxidoreductase [Salinibacterium sp.]
MISEVARGYWRAEESRDVDRIISFFTPDATWNGPRHELRGHDEIRRFYEESARAFPRLAVEIGEAFGSGDEAAISWSATFWDPAGAVYRLTGINVMREQGGRIAALTTFNDPSALTPQPLPRDRGRALVTGAATGIGAAIVKRLLADGLHVTGADIDAVQLDAFAGRLGADAAFTPVTCDVSADESIPLLVETASFDRRLDVLVNNAAVFLLAGVTATRQEWTRTLDVNLMAPARLVAGAADALAASGHGAVVNIASIAGHVAQANRWTYNAAKGGVLELTRCQALDLAPLGIRVNSVSPGYIWTAVLERAADGDREKWDPLWGQYAMLGRCGEPSEVASAVSFLCSSDATYITGADLLVDGGLATMSPDGKSAFDFS